MTKEEIHLFLELETTFTFAKSMANIPHSWICRKYYPDAVFLKVMNYINENGYKEKFYNKEYTYYNIGDYKYWVMTDDKGFNDSTAIINRAKIKL
jgi:hypothetical protein|tara:strand:+ start:309 stop:593 length:285 start_codon:yes stop_codon:yes gene_type:complete